MKGIFVNEDEKPYAYWIVTGEKTIETRSRDMLKKLVGERVAVISTKRGRGPLVVGYVTIYEKQYETMPGLFRLCTIIPQGSKYDTEARWMYFLEYAEEVYTPYPLPENAVRHGRSWCEWEE